MSRAATSTDVRDDLAPAERRDLMGLALLYRVADTDRLIERRPIATFACGTLVIFGVYVVVINVLERIMG